MKPPTNDYEALSSILFMAITSEDNSKYLTLAEQLCQRMNDIDIARAKRDVLKKLDLGPLVNNLLGTQKGPRSIKEKSNEKN